jgi:hypothetical protein
MLKAVEVIMQLEMNLTFSSRCLILIRKDLNYESGFQLTELKPQFLDDLWL